MPSLKVLLLLLLLAALALLTVVLFVKKSKPIHQDAQSYAIEHSYCNDIKKHSNKNELLECFFNFESISDFPEEPQGEDTLYISMAKLIGERFPNQFPLRIKHVFSWSNQIHVSEFMGISGNSINIVKEKDSVWRDQKTGCKFPGPCPVAPLRGEASVNAILPGKILSIENDSLYNVTIYHGENIYTKTSNLKTLSDYAQIGKTITPDSAIGFLPKQRTPFVEITRNGKRIELNKFIEENR